MGKIRHIAIVVRGHEYPDARTAALALGVRPGSVRRAIHAGSLDRLGLRQTGFAPMPIMIRGQCYDSARAAAAANGVSEGAVYTALSKGCINRVGLGRGPGNNAKPFRVGGLTWPSMAAASRALGFGTDYIGRTLRRGGRRARARILAAAMAYEARQIIAPARVPDRGEGSQSGRGTTRAKGAGWAGTGMAAE